MSNYIYGTMPVNEAIAKVVEYWASEILNWSIAGEVYIKIDRDGIITLKAPAGEGGLT